MAIPHQHSTMIMQPMKPPHRRVHSNIGLDILLLSDMMMGVQYNAASTTPPPQHADTTKKKMDDTPAAPARAAHCSPFSTMRSCKSRPPYHRRADSRSGRDILMLVDDMEMYQHAPHDDDVNTKKVAMVPLHSPFNMMHQSRPSRQRADSKIGRVFTMLAEDMEVNAPLYTKEMSIPPRSSFNMMQQQSTPSHQRADSKIGREILVLAEDLVVHKNPLRNDAPKKSMAIPQSRRKMFASSPHNRADSKIGRDILALTDMFMARDGSIVSSSTTSGNSSWTSIEDENMLSDPSKPQTHPFLVVNAVPPVKKNLRSSKKDVSTSVRAKRHLNNHGLQEDGRTFSFYPKKISLKEGQDVIGNSYAGGSGNTAKNQITHWMMDPLQLDEEETPDIFKSTVGYPIRSTIAIGGVMFGIKEEETLKACLVFRGADPVKEGKNDLLKQFIDLFPHSCAHALKSDRAERKRLGNYMARAEHLEETLSDWHRLYGPDDAHWYLSELAVDQESQGKGYGQEMMAAFVRLADRYERKVYLECGTNVEAFFSKFGFQEISAQNVNAEDGEGLDVKIMVREPIKKENSSLNTHSRR